MTGLGFDPKDDGLMTVRIVGVGQIAVVSVRAIGVITAIRRGAAESPTGSMGND